MEIEAAHHLWKRNLKLNIIGLSMAHSRVEKVFLHLFKICIFIFFPVGPVFGQDSLFEDKKIAHSLYITSNTGQHSRTDILSAIARASREDESASLLLLGNITAKKGFPGEEDKREEVKDFLRQDLLRPLKNFNGKIIFTPGANEWNAAAPESIDDLESFLQDNSNSDFWPDDGCPIEAEAITDSVELVSVDSEWFLEDWDDHSEMNSECEYKTREEFFAEFKDDLKDTQRKLTIVAIHHPVMSSSRIPFLQRVLGATPEAFESKMQRKLRGRLETLASLFDDVIFVSGNHKNLQFLDNGRNQQIISGAPAETEPAGTGENSIFSSEKQGYAKLTIFEDLSSLVEFFTVKEVGTQLLYSKFIQRERKSLNQLDLVFPEIFGDVQETSIYTSEETQKSSLYQWLWGDRYRQVYSQKIKAPILFLDSLPGNVRPISEGGGQQSRSLRLINDSKNEFTLRAMRKDPIQYIQADLVKDHFIGPFLQNTIAERMVSDFFTTAHPYAPFAVNELSTALKIHHANPEIFYLPRQRGLKIYNEDYGNALFMLEAHVGEENKEFRTFGSSENILSTADLLVELRESKNSLVDQREYLKARLFDMLIGDWDRHQDQWRWAMYTEDGKKRYEPIPRDRDHAFPKYDGVLMPFLKSAIPLLRKMQNYDEDLDDVKWFNWSGYPLDLRFITTANWNEWERQVRFIQENLTDKVIEQAFSSLPVEIQSNQEIAKIKSSLKERRSNLLHIARRYYEHLKDFQTITGTKEDDLFLISRDKSGETTVKIERNDDEVFSNTYNSEETEEIWLYGLDGEDQFRVSGEGEDLIQLRILGGVEHDTYDFKNTRQVKLYDYKSTSSTITNPDSKKWLVDSYQINQYHYKKRKYSANKVIPVVDYVSDAGLTFGIKDIYTTYGIARNPFTTQYILSAQYYFTSAGYELNASAEFAHIFYDWNFKLEGYYTSPNYLINYFGFGNETPYYQETFNKEYNRVKLEQWRISPSLIWRSQSGAKFSAGPLYESIRAVRQHNSFLSTALSSENDVFDAQDYAGVEIDFSFFNKNNPAYPTLGSQFEVHAGYKQNIDEHSNQFGYIHPSFSLDYPLVPRRFAVIATKLGGKAIIGDNFEFYHSATLGGNSSLRAYRNHRFNGKYSFFHSTDLRTAVGTVQTDFIPLVLGVSAGFDYGRVWIPNGTSKKWHTSYGGSFWINGFYALTGNIGLYHGGDGNRLTLTLNFKY